MSKHEANKNFYLLFVASAFSYSSFFIYSSVYAEYFKSIGKAQNVIGLLMGIILVTTIVVRPVVGRLNDLWGNKANLFIGMAFYSLAPALYIFSDSTYYLMFVRLAHGLGSSFFYTSALIYISSLPFEEKRSGMTGIYLTTQNVAIGLAPLAGIALYKMFYYSYFLALIPLFLNIISVAFILLLKTNPPAPKELQNSFFKDFPMVIRSKSLLRAGFTCFLTAASFGTIMSFLFYAKSEVPNPGVFNAAYGVTAIVIRLFTSRFIDKINKTTLIISSVAVMFFGVIIFAYANDSLNLIISGLFVGAGFCLVYPMLNTMVVEGFKKTEQAVALGVFTIFYDVGYGLGPIALSNIPDVTMLFIVAGFLAVVSLLPYLLIKT